MMPAKVYAWQIAPEYQESPLYYGPEFWPENIAVFGNRNYNEHYTGIFTGLHDALINAAEALDDMRAGERWNASFAEVLRDYLPPVGRGKYTRAERLEWAALLDRYSYDENNDDFARAASLISGAEYWPGVIRGHCQGDWQNIVYPAAWGRDGLAAFETEYFNTGTEWIVSDPLEAPPDDPGDVDGCAVYVNAWNTDGQRREIADAAGCDPADVVLYEFTGWSRTAVYKAVIE